MLLLLLEPLKVDDLAILSRRVEENENAVRKEGLMNPTNFSFIFSVFMLTVMIELLYM